MPDATIIPFTPPLPQVLPTIEGNVDYRDLRDQLLRIDQLLQHSGLETQLLQADLRRWLGRRKRVSAKRPTKPPTPLPARPALQYRPRSCSKKITAALPPAWPTAPCSSSLRHQRSGSRAGAQQKHAPTL